MSLKVVLPLSALVFGGSATVTTGVYFYSRGSGTNKGPVGDNKGPATTPPKSGQEKQKDDQSGEAMKKETSGQLPDPSSKGKENKERSNGSGGEESLRVAGTNENPQGPKPPEDHGSTYVQSPDQHQPKGPGTPSTPDNKEQLSDRQPGTDVPSEGGDSRTQKEEEEGKQDSVEQPADNTQCDGNPGNERNASLGGEGNTEPQPDSSTSPNGQGKGEVSEVAENAPTQPQEDSAERSEDDGKANPKSKGVDETVETKGGTKQNASDVSDTNSPESGSREGSPSSEQSQ